MRGTDLMPICSKSISCRVESRGELEERLELPFEKN